jgi:8-oxo-dGTP diphosphatase
MQFWHMQFWHMQVIGRPRREPVDDVKAVKWLSLKHAIETLTRPHEKVFLANVGPVALKAAKQCVSDKLGKKRAHRATPSTAWLHSNLSAWNVYSKP